jgi:hypothetical protein
LNKNHLGFVKKGLILIESKIYSVEVALVYNGKLAIKNVENKVSQSNKDNERDRGILKVYSGPPLD